MSGATVPLLPHPGEPGAPVTRFEAGARRGSDGALWLAWDLGFVPGALRLPAPAPPTRTDGLWRHTCFEAFLAAPGAAGYLEFNFSPSGAWAAYAFSACRTGMRPLVLDAPPTACWQRADTRLALELQLPAALAAGALRLALSAVIETSSGTISHWALRHPAGLPDFHHPDGFALELPAFEEQGAT